MEDLDRERRLPERRRHLPVSPRTSAHAYADRHTKRLESFGVTGIRAKFFDVNEALTSVIRGTIS